TEAQVGTRPEAQLMCLWAQLHQLKVEQTCHQHKDILDDTQICSATSHPRMLFMLSMPLKHIGITRMNINSQRFCLC
uniref:Uncharacterized protein n=1 Tax=Melopsittacus undulatus TaxID=13146 RepID=A0A8V5GU95_MELUD